LKPLAIDHIGFAAGNMGNLAGINQMDVKTTAVQDFK